MEIRPDVIPAPAARQYVGGISDMTLWRWERDPELGWPQPIRVRGRRFYRVADLDAFLQRNQQEAA